MIVIGIVGLISSGKTTVCETISQNGFKVINLDILVIRYIDLVQVLTKKL